MNKIILLTAAVSLLLLVSGCMSPTTTSTPIPTATPIETTTVVATETPFSIPTETPMATSAATSTGIPAVATTGTPVSTATPISAITSTPTANATTAATTATINVTSYPASAQGETNFTIQWQVTGGTPGTISNTSIIWGFNSGGMKISDYPRSSAAQTGSTPQTFNAELTAPSGGGPVYLRAHAIVDGVDIYSPEYQVTVTPVYTGAGGGGGY